MSSHKGKGAFASLDNVTDLSDLDGLGGGGFDALDQVDRLAALDAPDGLDPNDPIGALDYENLSNEEVATKETSAVLQAFIARSKAEQARFLLATDSEYWVGLCFQTREQKEHFLRESKLLQHGDKYLDGALLAKRMGIELPPANVPYNISAKVDAKYAALVKDV